MPADCLRSLRSEKRGESLVALERERSVWIEPFFRYTKFGISEAIVILGKRYMAWFLPIRRHAWNWSTEHFRRANISSTREAWCSTCI